MKTILSTIAGLLIITLAPVSSHGQSYTYVFIPQSNRSLPGFDEDLAAATITLNNNIGFFNNIMVNFTAYPTTPHDPMQLDLSGEISPASLSMLTATITTSSKTYFHNDEQIERDAEFDGTWVISSSVPVPDAGSTLPLLIISFAYLVACFHLGRRGPVP